MANKSKNVLALSHIKNEFSSLILPVFYTSLSLYTRRGLKYD